MPKLIILVNLLILTSLFPVMGQLVEISYYQSKSLKAVQLSSELGNFAILDDKKQSVAIQQIKDGSGLIYWYRRVATEVCVTGECRPIDVGIYWDCTGDFFGLTVFKEPLTKTDHSNFNDFDYTKLMAILADDWSILREYDLNDLTDEKQEASVDAVSGATKREIAEGAVEDAVYTTHTLWHLIHVGEKEQLSDLTASQLANERLLKILLKADKGKYQPFILEMFGVGKIKQSPEIEQLVLDAVGPDVSRIIQSVGIKAIAQLNMQAHDLQNQFALAYGSRNEADKMAILTAMQPIPVLSTQFYDTLASDLTTSNPWMAVKLLPILKDYKPHSQKVLEVVRSLSASEISSLKKAVENFINK